MKKGLKSKQSFAIFVDFIILVVLLSIVFCGFFITRLLLYPNESGEKALTVRTEYMPKEYRSDLSVGDTLYDTLTKRTVGEITKITTHEKDGKICFYLTFDAKFTPRSKSLRTRDLWFWFTTEGME